LDQSSVAQSQASAQFDGVTPLTGGASLSMSIEKYSPLWQDSAETLGEGTQGELASTETSHPVGPKGIARIEEVKFKVNGQECTQLDLVSEHSDLEVSIQFMSSLDVPLPNVAVIITDKAGRNISSCSNFYDGVALKRDTTGRTRASVCFPKIPLFRGKYGISVFLLCERAIHIYDSANVAEMDITQVGLELGVVALSRRWSV
jgi:lipopolysaccharide transport system ATP-binding protein